jgi:hypothetical protein
MAVGARYHIVGVVKQVHGWIETEPERPSKFDMVVGCSMLGLRNASVRRVSKFEGWEEEKSGRFMAQVRR